MSNPLVSVIIPTKDPEDWFPDVLDAILSQDFSGKVEIIVIDSSSDCKLSKSVEFRGLRYCQIDPRQFSHGGTRNSGVNMASGNYVVFLSQDALPADRYWLQNIIEPMERDPKVAGVFSKQIPGDHTHPMEKYFLFHLYGKKAKLNFKNEDYDLTFDDVFFSNVSSAIRRKVVLSFPFDANLVMSEDQEWSKRVIEAGWKTVYEPGSTVVHSHNSSMMEVFQRNFDSGASLHNIFEKLPGGILKQIKSLWGLVLYLCKESKAQYIPAALAYEAMKAIGFTFGWYERFLPAKCKIYFGQHKGYWQKACNSQ